MPAATKEGDGGWKKFLWNSEKREFLGRTGGSWGLTHTPRSEKTELSFTLGESSSFKKHVKAMHDFLEAYNDTQQLDQMKYEDCGDVPATYKMRGALDDSQGSKKACVFRRSWLDKCSGLEDPDFGFSDGRPCLIVKLNRIVNFLPKPPANVTIGGVFVPDVVPINCSAKRPEDADKMQEIKYYGLTVGFPLQYYPYYGKQLHPQYLQPLVAVQFGNITVNTELRIECKVYGLNINYSDKDRFQGRFDVKLTIKTKS
ncbi:sodium/potassium-transporting ATPase subunit beta-1-like isoform X2 [Conger conger]|uniref:sodium/potassium-transporting ATPase subunit beta-1-like isoform X2 n=1 Tax=Conger conger TaxID=82655 RepID=UPI002A59C1E1|nr:sodium/potassium-transporting ATPase subunit beta-1-like isoform X2 [Conger conger]